MSPHVYRKVPRFNVLATQLLDYVASRLNGIGHFGTRRQWCEHGSGRHGCVSSLLASPATDKRPHVEYWNLGVLDKNEW
jgi:hypothetical protein